MKDEAAEQYKSKWIPISDKTQEPQDGVRYDIYNKQGNILPAIYERGEFYRFIDNSGADRVSMSIFYTTVTHYRPLPQPPIQ